MPPLRRGQRGSSAASGGRGPVNTLGRRLRNRGLLLAVVATAACLNVDEPQSVPVTVHACPQSACSAYAQTPAPTCGASGSCEVPVPTGVILVVSVPIDAPFAASSQFVLPLERLDDCPACASCMNCLWPACGYLPGTVGVIRGYQIQAAG